MKSKLPPGPLLSPLQKIRFIHLVLFEPKTPSRSKLYPRRQSPIPDRKNFEKHFRPRSSNDDRLPLLIRHLSFFSLHPHAPASRASASVSENVRAAKTRGDRLLLSRALRLSLPRPAPVDVSLPSGQARRNDLELGCGVHGSKYRDERSVSSTLSSMERVPTGREVETTVKQAKLIPCPSPSRFLSGTLIGPKEDVRFGVCLASASIAYGTSPAQVSSSRPLDFFSSTGLPDLAPLFLLPKSLAALNIVLRVTAPSSLYFTCLLY